MKPMVAGSLAGAEARTRAVPTEAGTAAEECRDRFSVDEIPAGRSEQTAEARASTVFSISAESASRSANKDV